LIFLELNSFETIIRALNGSGVRYLVVGGMAVVVHGHGRMTHDLDLVIALDHDNVLRAFAALQGLDYRPRVPVTAAQFADPAQRQAWIEHKNMTVLNLYSDRFRTTPVDLFVQEPFDFDRAYENAHVADLDGIAVHVVDLATLIAMKQVADRTIDRDDIRHLRILQDQCDREGGLP
jgi:predicted nucleotidyltransferase